MVQILGSFFKKGLREMSIIGALTSQDLLLKVNAGLVQGNASASLHTFPGMQTHFVHLVHVCVPTDMEASISVFLMCF